MRKFLRSLNWPSGGPKQALVVACGVAVLAAAVPMTMALGSSFASTPALTVLPAAQHGLPQAVLTDTATTTATVTATATLTGTYTATATHVATGTATSTRTGTVAATGTVTETKVTICHRTGSSSNPYVRITVSQSALNAHRGHGDLIPAPPGGCPVALTPAASTTSSVSATATTTPPVSATATTTPSVSATPLVTSTSVVYKVPICHRTGSSSNPWVLITVSQNALDAHRGHGDLIPAPSGGCPVATAHAVTQPKSNGHNGNNGNAGKSKANSPAKANSPSKAPAKAGQGKPAQGNSGQSQVKGNGLSNGQGKGSGKPAGADNAAPGKGADKSDKGNGKKP